MDYFEQELFELKVMNTDGSEEELIKNLQLCLDAQFIPNSTNLLYTGVNHNEQNKSLNLINVETKEHTVICPNMNSDRTTTVTKDGSLIFFINKDENSEYNTLYSYDLNTGLTVDLTPQESGYKHSPVSLIYNEEQYLLFVSRYTINDLQYSSIKLLNLISNELKTIYTQEYEYPLGHSQLSYDNDNDILFARWGFYDLIKFSSLINGSIEVMKFDFILDLQMNHEENFMLISNFDITILEYTNNNNIVYLNEGEEASTRNDKIVFTIGGTANHRLFIMTTDGMNKTVLNDYSIKPQLSYDGKKICFIKNYTTID